MARGRAGGRMRRVDEAVKQVLSEMIPTLKDPRIGFVTVTGVDTTSDLAQATVWVSVLGNDKQRAATMEALEHSVGPLQGALGTQLRLRRTPKVRFAYDPAIERGVRMSQLIDDLVPLDTDLANVDERIDDGVPEWTTRSDLEQAVAVIRDHHRFLVTSHENPDGDALGSLLAMQLALGQLGKDSVMILTGAAPLPGEYRFLGLPERGLRRDLPADSADRVLLALDCANATRPADSALLDGPLLTVNIDHHHDNSRFAAVNVVVPDASSTGEILVDTFRLLGVEITPAIAEPLYVALVTDTGRFQYTNTTPKTHRLAADLIEAGADVRNVFQNVYETVQFPKLKLLAHALERAVRFESGRVVVSHLLRADFGEAGAVEPYSEGIIDYLRGVEGVQLAVLIREPPRDGSPVRKVSLRSSIDALDVSALAREFGGGGHRQAAGFGTDLSVEAITERLVAGFAAATAQ
jgi:bifunctional oligoribonuclease and PAP phosphatase NrnA